MWRRTGPGLFVPAWVSDEVVEQRILESGARLGEYGAVSGWASLRWRGAAYFDGIQGVRTCPVPLAIGLGTIRPDPALELLRRQCPPHEWNVQHGLRCTLAARALYDELVRLGALRPGVVALDMAVTAGVLTLEEFGAFLEAIGPRNGVVLARRVLILGRDDVWSPQETWMRLVWLLDAGLPEPGCNVPVFDLRENLIGIPDLFDEEAGLVVEYQGAIHRSRRQHRRDVHRAERFRDHRLEYLEVVGGDLGSGATPGRMQRARSRGLFLPPDRRTWTLEQPAWWRERDLSA